MQPHRQTIHSLRGTHTRGRRLSGRAEASRACAHPTARWPRRHSLPPSPSELELDSAARRHADRLGPLSQIYLTLRNRGRGGQRSTHSSMIVCVCPHSLTVFEASMSSSIFSPGLNAGWPAESTNTSRSKRSRHVSPQAYKRTECLRTFVWAPCAPEGVTQIALHSARTTATHSHDRLQSMSLSFGRTLPQEDLTPPVSSFFLASSAPIFLLQLGPPTGAVGARLGLGRTTLLA